jgi:outer membrane protein insertion porin family
VTGRLRNVFGGAESLELNASKGTRTKSAYQVCRNPKASFVLDAYVRPSQLNFTTPLAASPLLDFSLSGFALNRDHSAFASHLEQTHGGRAKLSVSLLSSHRVLQPADHLLALEGKSTMGSS